jgi:hypothetical protein
VVLQPVEVRMAQEVSESFSWCAFRSMSCSASMGLHQVRRLLAMTGEQLQRDASVAIGLWLLIHRGDPPPDEAQVSRATILREGWIDGVH